MKRRTFIQSGATFAGALLGGSAFAQQWPSKTVTIVVPFGAGGGTTDPLARILADIELFSLNRGEVDDLFSRIDAVTVEKANEIARRFYGGKGLAILLLENASKFVPEVKKYDPEPQVIPIATPGMRVPQ